MRFQKACVYKRKDGNWAAAIPRGANVYGAVVRSWQAAVDWLMMELRTNQQNYGADGSGGW